MAYDIGVLVVHGMGAQTPTFADPMVEELEDRLEDEGIVRGSVCWQSAYWADLLNQTEEQLWYRLKKENRLDLVTFRRFVINAFGDAVAYRRSEGDPVDATYNRIHTRIFDSLRALRDTLAADRPMVVMAHSLGSVIMSDFIWNQQRQNRLARGGGTFFAMETLCGIVTFGSNIPLFTLALPRVEAITFPPATLPNPLRAAAKWINFFDPDDVLGWPLKPLSASYDTAVHSDNAINAGGIFTSWNPASHSQYWTDNSFTRPVTKLLASLVSAARQTPLPVVAPHAAARSGVEVQQPPNG